MSQPRPASRRTGLIPVEIGATMSTSSPSVLAELAEEMRKRSDHQMDRARGGHDGALDRAEIWLAACRLIETALARHRAREVGRLLDDHVVDHAAHALADDFYGVGWDNADPEHQDNLRSEARLVLESASEILTARKKED